MSNQNVKRTFGPVAFAASAANVYNNASSLIYDIITHIHVVNTTSGSLWFNLFCSQVSGTETAGKELFVEQAVAAYSAFDWYGRLKLVTADYLVGHDSSGTGLTITGMGEQFVV